MILFSHGAASTSSTDNACSTSSAISTAKAIGSGSASSTVQTGLLVHVL